MIVLKYAVAPDWFASMEIPSPSVVIFKPPVVPVVPVGPRISAATPLYIPLVFTSGTVNLNPPAVVPVSPKNSSECCGLPQIPTNL